MKPALEAVKARQFAPYSIGTWGEMVGKEVLRKAAESSGTGDGPIEVTLTFTVGGGTSSNPGMLCVPICVIIGGFEVCGCA